MCLCLRAVYTKYQATSMASIQKYTVGGRSYWRIVESRRVNGKPRAIPLVHLGTAASLLAKLSALPESGELLIKSYEHGGVAAIVALEAELNLKEIINRHLPKARRGVSAGDALFLIAMNRLLNPCSKQGWAEWSESTSLFRFMPHLKLLELSSQFFWEHMQHFTPEALRAIEEDILQVIIKKFNISLDCLLLDTTNCFTYLADGHADNELFQYGHSKEMRDNKLLFGVSLLVARESKIPLLHSTYPGNQHDSKLFPKTLQTIVERLDRLHLVASDITLVFDRGFFSQANILELQKKSLGFVTALRLGDIPRELFDIPRQKYRRIKRGENTGIWFYSQPITLWENKLTAVFYLSESAKALQEKILNDQLARALCSLHEWNAALLNQAGKSDHAIDPIAVKKKISVLLRSPYLKEILSISYDPTLPREKRLAFSVNEKAKADIILKYFGKRCLISNRDDWHPSQIIDTYFSQAYVEHAFRAAKDPSHISIRPQFHWTDQSLTAHVFSCFLALLLGQLLLLKANKKTSVSSLPKLLAQLSRVRLAAVVRNAATPKPLWKLETISALQKKILVALDIPLDGAV